MSNLRLYRIKYGTKRSMVKSGPEEIGNDIVYAAAFCKESGCEVFVSAILLRGDKLIEKGQTVNRKTKHLRLAKNICFLEHRNFNAKYHLNRSKLHPSNRNKVQVF